MKLKQPVYQENGYVSISTVHSKTHSMCPIDTGNVGPMGPVRYPIQYHHLEFSPYPKARLMCQEWFKELLYQENGCVPIKYGTFQSTVLSYPHMKYWTHRSNIQYYTITLNRVLTQRQVWYAMHDSKSYCTRKMAASQSRSVHSKTHSVCPIDTRNIGPIGPISSTIISPWIESLPKGRSDMPCMIQRATVQGKRMRPNHARYIPQGLSYPHKKYWTHRSIIRYYTITLNRVLTQRQVWYAMYDSKSYCTRKMAAPQSRTVHSKTHKVCTIHTRNIGPIGLISSAKPSPWIESLPRGRTEIQYIISRATVPGKWLRPYHVRYILRPTVCVLSTQEILDPSVQYPVQYHHLESSPYPNSPAA